MDIASQTGRPAARGPAWRTIAWCLCGAGVLCAQGLHLAVARNLLPRAWPVAACMWLAVAAMVAPGAVYLLAVLASPRGRLGLARGVVLIAVAVALRAGMACLFPTPRGDDYSRYLWDGAMTAAGISPYRYSPAEAADANLPDPAARAVAARGADVVGPINHPHLRTIYPPVAQGLFAAAHVLTPFRPAGWRAVLIALDALTAGLVVLLLRRAALPLSLAAVYLWNPLLVFETYGRMHVDLAAAPLVLLTAWAILHRRPVVAAAALAGAVGVKLWPALLLPFVAAAFWRDRARLATAMATFAVLLAAMAVPYAAAFAGGSSGLVAYGTHWRQAPGAFRLFEFVGQPLSRLVPIANNGQLVPRGLLLLVLLAAACWAARGSARNAARLTGRMALVALLVLLLGPTVWPWYYVAMVPLAVLRPRIELLLWTALLPLVYFQGAPIGESAAAALVHLPVWMALAIGLWRRRRPIQQGPSGPAQCSPVP